MAEKLLIRGSNGYRLTIILQVFFFQLFVCLFFAVQMASRHGSVTVTVNNGSVTCTVQALVTWLASSLVKAQLLTAQVSFSKETLYFQFFFLRCCAIMRLYLVVSFQRFFLPFMCFLLCAGARLILVIILFVANVRR